MMHILYSFWWWHPIQLWSYMDLKSLCSSNNKIWVKLNHLVMKILQHDAHSTYILSRFKLTESKIIWVSLSEPHSRQICECVHVCLWQYDHYLLMLVSHPQPAWNFASRIKLVIKPIFPTAYAHIWSLTDDIMVALRSTMFWAAQWCETSWFIIRLPAIQCYHGEYTVWMSQTLPIENSSNSFHRGRIDITVGAPQHFCWQQVRNGWIW